MRTLPVHLLSLSCYIASSLARCSGITTQASPFDNNASASPNSTDLLEGGSNLQQQLRTISPEKAAAPSTSSATSEFSFSTDVQPSLPPTASTQSQKLLLAKGLYTRWNCKLCNIVFNSAQALGGHRSNSGEHRLRLSEAACNALPSCDKDGVSVDERSGNQGDKTEEIYREDPKEWIGSLKAMVVAEPPPLRAETGVSVDRVRRDVEGLEGGERGNGVRHMTPEGDSIMLSPFSLGPKASPAMQGLREANPPMPRSSQDTFLTNDSRIGRRGLQMSSLIIIEGGSRVNWREAPSDHSAKDDIKSGMNMEEETNLLLTQLDPLDSWVRDHDRFIKMAFPSMAMPQSWALLLP